MAVLSFGEKKKAFLLTLFSPPLFFHFSIFLYPFPFVFHSFKPTEKEQEKWQPTAV